MFRNAKVGDRVWSMRKGWGVITCRMYYETILRVEFVGGRSCHYYTNGKENELDKYPSLFWDEVKFKIPEKPFDLEEEYRKLERKEFNGGERNWCIVFDYMDIEWRCSYDVFVSEVGTICFENCVNDFANLLNEHNITPKQLSEVVRKVEREEEDEKK